MNSPRQLLPILKQMLGLLRFGPLPLLVWLGLSTTCLVASSVFLLVDHQKPADFMGALFVWCCLIWFFLMLVASPLPFQLLGGLISLEFAFTRAIDRGLWLRTERIAVCIIALLPLLLNLLLSPLSPKLAFDRAEAGSRQAALQERYLNIFPGSRVMAAEANGDLEQLVIRHGTETFAAWLVWFGAGITFLVAAYWSVAFLAWQRGGWHHSKSKWRPWLGFTMLQVPFFLPIIAAVICATLRINPCEECFLLFARHPLVLTLALVALIGIIQPLTERNIRRMEFEFF